jgi:hypothetical protein
MQFDIGDMALIVDDALNERNRQPGETANDDRLPPQSPRDAAAESEEGAGCRRFGVVG